jgi:hypothetical protein
MGYIYDGIVKPRVGDFHLDARSHKNVFKAVYKAAVSIERDTGATVDTRMVNASSGHYQFVADNEKVASAFRAEATKLFNHFSAGNTKMPKHKLEKTPPTPLGAELENWFRRAETGPLPNPNQKLLSAGSVGNSEDAVEPPIKDL